MCGIWAIFGTDHDLLPYFTVAYNKIHHRGPDAWRIENDHRFRHCSLGFHRLAIVDDMFGMQPMRIKSLPHLWVICNGEIYNFNRLQEIHDFKYETRCDVEVILHLYAKGGIDFCVKELDGVFAFCLLDIEKRKIFLARDTFGVRPAFKLTNKKGFLAVCSEAKGLMDLKKGLNDETSIEPFSPSCYEEYTLLETGTVSFIRHEQFHVIGNRPQYNPLVQWNDLDPISVHDNIQKLLTAAVRKRLMSNRRIGCLLSGGLDSSLVASLLVKLAKEENINYPIQTFSIGMLDSPDILAARKVAKYIGSEHHEVLFSPEDALQVIDEVVYHLESYDITTVRASIGMYLVSKYIATKTDTVVILSGEGADELAQGYMYFHAAPSAEDGDKDSRRLLDELYLFDVLRGDRTTTAHGLEIRVPFLDHQFTSYYLSLPAEQRQPQHKIEKHLLRSAFTGSGLLPDEILWRPKEAFSDGVCKREKSLYEYIQEFAENQVDDATFAKASENYSHNPPPTKEALYYRQVFEKHYNGHGNWIPHFWMPRWTKATDPSARVLNEYAAAHTSHG